MCGDLFQILQFFLADFARGTVDGAQKGDIIGSREHSEIGNTVFDFSAGIKFRAAVDFVGKCMPGKALFKTST